MNNGTWPTLYIPHGGGPCFSMEPRPPWPRDSWDRMGRFLRKLDSTLGLRPRAALVVSAHWEAPWPTVNSAGNPGLLFDYYGFPEHTYRLTYPVAGAPSVADEIRAALAASGYVTDADDNRGLDHGVFVPFMLVYPDADVPIVQLSLQQDLDAGVHLAIGRALAPLRRSGILIVGAGMSYHDVRGFDGLRDDEAEAFDAWLGEAVVDTHRRNAALAAWNSAPGAQKAHPRPEHLLPLMIAAGAAEGEVGARIYSDHVFGKPVSGFRFGELPNG